MSPPHNPPPPPPGSATKTPPPHPPACPAPPPPAGAGHDPPAPRPPVLRAGFASVFRGTRLDRIPVAPDIGRIEIEAHRNEPAFARKLQRVRSLGEAGDADRRVRRLLRL